MNKDKLDKLNDEQSLELVFSTYSVSDLILNRNHRFTERNSSSLGSFFFSQGGAFLFPGSPE